MGDPMTTPAPQVGRAPQRCAQHKTLIGSTDHAEAVKNLPSELRTRACARSLEALAAAMGISPELAAKVVEAIRADAKSSASGKARTARVLVALKAMGFEDAHEPAIRILAGAIGVALETGPTAGATGIGRPLGAKDRSQRRPMAGRPSRGDDVRRLRVEHPDWTLEQIGEAVGGMSKQGVAKHLARST